MENEKYILRSIAVISLLLFVLSDVFSIGFLPDVKLERDMAARILPEDGYVLPVTWGDLGMRMIESGVIDEEKFIQTHDMNEEDRKMLYESDNGKMRISTGNSRLMLNMLWALGLGNKNTILEAGPMTDEKYGGDPSRFASTGGWTLAGGNIMDHYSKHTFIELTPEQQELVKRVAQGIYRPCCGNPTHFPDCNHGMAMLGFLELMASQGVSEDEMYATALKVNSFWFPDTYVTIAAYLDSQGISWKKTDPKEILGASYSSAMGYQQIVSKMNTKPQGGASCGV